MPTKEERRELLRQRDPLVCAEAVCRSLRISVGSLKKLIADGEFPQPMMLSAKIKRWHINDICCYLWQYQMKSRMGRPDHDEIGRDAQLAKDYRSEKIGFIYFVRGGEFVKIGYATDVASRLSGLKTNCPFELTLVFSMPGTFQTEIGLHRRFKAHATSGEWFRWCDEIEQFIESMRSAGER